MYILFFIFLVPACIYFLFLLKVLNGLKKLKISSLSGTNNDFNDMISVIIPFRNESSNILASLESLTGQVFPKDRYEVIYVDDSSEDDSIAKIQNAKKPFNIKVISVPKSSHERGFKKIAILEALKSAQGDIIVTTDCDCLQPPMWLSNIASCFDYDTAFVSGPVEFLNNNKFFGGLQRAEFAGLVLTGAGLIGSGFPVICNGANLAFRKVVFEQAGGYSDNMTLTSGEDELLMQKIASQKKYKIKFAYDKEAVVKTHPNNTFKEFYQQRKRWASKGLFYKSKMLIAILIMIFSFFLSFPVMLMLGLFFPLLWIEMIVLFIMKAGMEYFILSEGAENIFDKDILDYFIPAQVIHIPYILVSAVSGAFGQYAWKNRKVER